MKNVVIIGGSGAPEVVQSFGIKKKKLIKRVDNKLHKIDYLRFRHEGTNVLFVLRHGKKHTKDPARLKPKYLAKQLSKLVNPKKTLVIQTSASGSLDTSIKLVDEGGIVVCDDVMRGFGFRGSSRSIVNPDIVHAVIQGAYSERARKLAGDAIGNVPGAIAYRGGIYIENEGNRFETKSEVADLFERLSAPQYRLDEMRDRKILFQSSYVMEAARMSAGWNEEVYRRMDHMSGKMGQLDQDIEVQERLRDNLSVTHAQVSMNAAKEVEPLIEAGFKDIVLLAFPVNYGVGLVPDEKVDHERTSMAIKKATKPYIAPTLTSMIQMAPDYIK